ncbi:S41 family peptidase [Pedobacter sp. KR3-3]|uniref:S41 family peptidase n=1 Tax=Pedobacter albus TaxID=3113905 RepID=A0ABU7I290_9SPHI|nr:S41 family peptidase [Pedobacter sp. KR3-3]MEE1943575.1 S41 family peptidase [Pedobacter sp. KR3-3]
MKKTLLTSLLGLIGLTAFAQIKNTSFDEKKENAKWPESWAIKEIPGSTVQIDDNIKFSGSSSLKISTNEGVEPSKFASFSQTIPLNLDKTSRATISVYLKTENLMGSAAIWCQVWDDKNKSVGFVNLGSQNEPVKGTNDWKKYSMTLILDRTAKRLVLGGYSMGAGSTWFDDIAFESAQANSKPASKEVKNYIAVVNAIIKDNSIYTDSLNWGAINADIEELGKGLETTADAQMLTNFMLQKLRAAGDNHSFFQPKVAAQQYASGNTSQQKPTFKLLDNHIGYIMVPSYGSTDTETGKAFANEIQGFIKKLDTENTIKGWIVDLRPNTGGNMHPMIAGLGPIIGRGTLGYFVKGKSKTPWYYTKEGEGAGKGITVKIDQPYELKNPNSKVAVLIGPRTSSSGEMTTVSFIGKKNAKLFGEQSGGYTTANTGYPLPDGSFLYLASSYVADRNMKKYIGKITPDVVVKPVAGEDTVLKTAETWVLDSNP